MKIFPLLRLTMNVSRFCYEPHCKTHLELGKYPKIADATIRYNKPITVAIILKNNIKIGHAIVKIKNFPTFPNISQNHTQQRFQM